jgi:hypothetical protein
MHVNKYICTHTHIIYHKQHTFSCCREQCEAPLVGQWRCNFTPVRWHWFLPPPCTPPPQRARASARPPHTQTHANTRTHDAVSHQYAGTAPPPTATTHTNTRKHTHTHTPSLLHIHTHIDNKTQKRTHSLAFFSKGRRVRSLCVCVCVRARARVCRRAQR